MGGLLQLLAVLCLFALRGHAGMGLYARLLVMMVAGFVGTQVLCGKRLPGFDWRTRS